MKKLRLAACMLMLALAGCDNNDNAPTAVKKDAPSEVTKAASSENASSAKLSAPERQKLAQQSAGNYPRYPAQRRFCQPWFAAAWKSH